MARLARLEVFAFDEVAVVHVMNRVVRRCFLLGDDPISGKNYDHRKLWIEDQLRVQAANFGVDLLGFTILSNHFHLILRSRPDCVEKWADAEVARRWLMLCPVRRDEQGNAEEPNEMELNSIRNDPDKLKMIRSRLSDISWWMRILCQRIAMKANHEDGEVGKFFQSRFRAVRLLDEQALVACAAYVDLNPIRAAMAETLETSDFTSVQRRIQALEQTTSPEGSSVDQGAKSASAPAQPSSKAKRTKLKVSESAPDRFLSPVSLDERTGKSGSVAHQDGFRCSDKGFLPMSLGDYLILLDWTARQLSQGKRGRTPNAVKPILKRLSLDRQAWCELVGTFDKKFYQVAGQPTIIDSTTSRVSQHRYRIPVETRTMYSDIETRRPKPAASQTASA